VKLQATYPDTPQLRDQWIVENRGPRNFVDPSVPYAFFTEDEHLHDGEVGAIATIFLTNRECPWHCAMCDLWKNTTVESVPRGSIPQQIEYALSRLPAARQVKLYNSGSFFDPHAIPTTDYPAIASLVRHFERVIVESHPALVRENCFTFENILATKLEVAMGLETVHPIVLEKLNKRMTLNLYQSAAQKLLANGIDLRSFILVQPPFMVVDESLHWACRSIDFAVGCDATAISLIPTRPGDGAMEILASTGAFTPPALSVVEDALDYGLSLHAGRVCVDMWEIDRIACKTCCQAERLERIRKMNLSQRIFNRIGCAHSA
jgi:radical SAM enzyme (TIGR01210 family)